MSNWSNRRAWAIGCVSISGLVGCAGPVPSKERSGPADVGASLAPPCDDPCSISCTSAVNVRTNTSIAAQAAAYATGDPVVDDYALLRAAADYAGVHPGVTL